MDEKERKFKEIMRQFMKAMHQFSKMEETPMDFGSGDILFRSEIHTIEAIGHKEGLNVTELAAVLEITKGTVSQLVSKLARKGLVLKKKGDRNDKEITLELTPRGRKAFDGHQRFHREIYLDFMQIYSGVSHEQLEAFQEVLIVIRNNINRYINWKSINSSDNGQD
jgi:DNA-binding MarR family transcriptional regulator